MSGIVGIFWRNGAVVERPILQALTNYISYRGPDAREVWSDGTIGFGHTMLRTTREAATERQPANLDDRLWITADARIDCRAELIRKLEQANCRLAAAPTDAELVLHAYDAWGEGCVHHLCGDFGFAIWDARDKKLFCARDHFGIKPFFYVVNEHLFLLSNTLNCLRMHPQVSEELNESAIGDFLLFGMNCNAATTTFRDIQRLPPAHSLTVSANGFRTQRYWSPPVDGRIRYKRPEEYVEQFREILKAAVGDRLRAERAGVLLSGGLDSGSIAATARELSDGPRGASDLRAYTMVYESLFADTEGDYARKSAEYLGMPTWQLAMDGMEMFDQWDDPELVPPEPVEDPFFGSLFHEFGAIATDCRIALSGDGADPLLDFQIWPYAKDLLRIRDWPRFCGEMSQFLLVRPFPWRGIQKKLKRFAGRDSTMPEFPGWIAAGFAARADLEERWARNNQIFEPFVHPVRPRAHASLGLRYWMFLFEQEDPGVTHRAVEVRYPFFDLRLVNYLLAIPPFPWCFEKRLLREAMRGRLPEAIRRRPKSLLPINPFAEILRRSKAAWIDHPRLCEDAARYVDISKLSRLRDSRNPESTRAMIRPVCLNFWLQSALRLRYKLPVRAFNG